jgi:hypothetical protein
MCYNDVSAGGTLARQQYIIALALLLGEDMGFAV